MPFEINRLRCKFNKPIYLQDEISFEVNDKNENIRINAIQNGEIKIIIYLNVCEKKSQFNPKEKWDLFTADRPNDIPFGDLDGYSKKLKCSISAKLAVKMYGKEFVDKIGIGQLAEIVSFSRIVGLHAPGLNSIFSELQINSDVVEKKDNIFFKVQSIDERFNIVNIESNGPSFNASLKTFYRPVLVKQKTIKQMKDNLNKEEFIDFRALIIGGSRGLGEFTAKSLGYGGAKLMITYAKGKNDVTNVSKDIKKYNKSVSLHCLDVMNFQDVDYEILKKFDPTHVFYFATPFIFIGVKNKFCRIKYDKFKRYYVDAFQVIVEILSKNNTQKKHFFYPSSVAIDEQPNDMLEYTLAKKNGELLCSELEKKYPQIKIYKPRLPRLETDQTVSLSSVKNEDPVAILKIIRSMK